MYKFNRGITLIEILIVISIIVIIATIVLPNLSNFKNLQSLKNSTDEVVDLLSKAKNQTISSLESTNYGVHFQSDKAVLFSGSVYNASDLSNKEVVLDSRVEIPSVGGINITGGSNVIFERLTGNTQNSGTIKVQLKSNPSKQKVITINKVGVISLN